MHRRSARPDRTGPLQQLGGGESGGGQAVGILRRLLRQVHMQHPAVGGRHHRRHFRGRHGPHGMDAAPRPGGRSAGAPTRSAQAAAEPSENRCCTALIGYAETACQIGDIQQRQADAGLGGRVGDGQAHGIGFAYRPPPGGWCR